MSERPDNYFRWLELCAGAQQVGEPVESEPMTAESWSHWLPERERELLERAARAASYNPELADADIAAILAIKKIYETVGYAGPPPMPLPEPPAPVSLLAHRLRRYRRRKGLE